MTIGADRCGDSVLDGNPTVRRAPQLVVAAVDGKEQTIAIPAVDQVERRLRFGGDDIRVAEVLLQPGAENGKFELVPEWHRDAAPVERQHITDVKPVDRGD